VADQEEIPFFYSNVVQAHIGAFDFTFEFGYKPPEEAATARYEPRCRVVMSLSHAKTMLPIIARLIAQYEENVGPITAPGYEEKGRE
jgi:Protein of unknown function (DUF3467)